MSGPKATASRRGFLKFALVGTGAGLLQACAPTSQTPIGEIKPSTLRPVELPKTFDFTKNSAAQGADQIVKSACQFCNANCGLNVNVRAGRVVGIEPFDDDPVQAGQLCIKAELMGQMVYNPRRLKRPLVRVSGAKGSQDSEFKEVSWDEALEVIATKFLHLRDECQAHTITNRTT